MKKNIVIVVSAMNMGGAQRVASILCNYWSENGHDVTLISTFTGDKKSHFYINEDVNRKYLTNSPFFLKNTLFNQVWKLINLRKVLKNQNPDIVISFLATVNVATAISTIGIKSPLIICERTWPPFASLSKHFLWAYKFLFKSVDTIVVQTEKSKSWLFENFSSNDVTVIPNPVLHPLPTENKQSVCPSSVITNNKKHILASGRMHKFKQFDLLIKAFSKIKDKFPDWNLIILGDGEEKVKLEQLLYELDINNRVYFPGSVGNISEWYEAADLFVLSSVVEGFPNVLLEAMSYGLACISFDCDTGPRDMIHDGFNGILIDPEEKEIGLLNAMDKIISNKKIRTTMASNSITVREKYSVRNIMQKWDDIIEQ